ncbi:FAD:protein FMN transferase [Flavobacteriaceae bacterium KMM 6898]|nr:FAD:protein FMN transferase [Flavobacteriaceae bacterium KMM 6898]
MKQLFSFVLFFLIVTSYGQDQQYVTVQKVMKLMGSRFEITVVTPNEEIGYINIEEAAAEIQRIEKIISSWDENSETSEINRNAGVRPVKISGELFKLIERCKQVSEITDGAFDITFASMDQVWKFDGSMQYPPKETEIKNSVAKVSYHKIIMDSDEGTVLLKDKGMKIGFGAIGKGYAADKAKELLQSKQVRAGIINAAGDLTTWGTKVSGEKWLIGIANPLSKDKIFSWLPIVESSVATSGNYEKYVTFGGVKYTHIIDPRTGYPATGINSVSIFTKTAELSDALATAVYIMGVDTGLALISQLRGTEAIIVDSENKIHKSKGITFENNK